jgi:hypothetical protein
LGSSTRSRKSVWSEERDPTAKGSAGNPRLSGIGP